jgi:hypothetical protein
MPSPSSSLISVSVAAGVAWAVLAPPPAGAPPDAAAGDRHPAIRLGGDHGRGGDAPGGGRDDVGAGTDVAAMAVEHIARVGDKLAQPVATLDLAPVALAAVDHQWTVHDPSFTKCDVRAHAQDCQTGRPPRQSVGNP